MPSIHVQPPTFAGAAGKEPTAERTLHHVSLQLKSPIQTHVHVLACGQHVI